MKSEAISCFALWQAFTSDAGLIGDNGQMLRVGFRESKLPFYRARMMLSDEVKSRTKLMQVILAIMKSRARAI